MVRSRRQKEREQQQKFKGILLLTFSTVVILAIGGTKLWLETTRLEIDEQTLCPVTGPEAFTAILVKKNCCNTV